MQARQRLAQHGELLGLNLWAKTGKAGDIAVRPGEARDETAADRIVGGSNDDGDGGRGVPCCHYSGAAHEHHRTAGSWWRRRTLRAVDRGRTNRDR